MPLLVRRRVLWSWTLFSSFSASIQPFVYQPMQSTHRLKKKMDRLLTIDIKLVLEGLVIL